MILAAEPLSSIYTPGVYRAFCRYAVSWWPTPDHRERVEVDIADYGQPRSLMKSAALRRGAIDLRRPADECCIGYLTTVTRRIDE
jgi:hypothetical protein